MTRKSSFSMYQRFAASKSGTRTATWCPFIDANGLVMLWAGGLLRDIRTPREVESTNSNVLSAHRCETTYVRQVWIKSSQALIRYEPQVHNPGDAKTRAPYPTNSAIRSPARIGRIRMRGGASQLCSRVRRARRDHDGDLENHQAARGAVGRTPVHPYDPQCCADRGRSEVARHARTRIG